MLLLLTIQNTMSTTIPRPFRRLRHLYQLQMIHESHYEFIIAWLHNGIVLKGLHLNIMPMVPGIKSLKTCCVRSGLVPFLTLLGDYLNVWRNINKVAVSQLTTEIALLEMKLKHVANFNEDFNQIKSYTQRVRMMNDKWKSSKLADLIANKRKWDRW